MKTPWIEQCEDWVSATYKPYQERRNRSFQWSYDYEDGREFVVTLLEAKERFGKLHTVLETNDELELQAFLEKDQEAKPVFEVTYIVESPIKKTA